MFTYFYCFFYFYLLVSLSYGFNCVIVVEKRLHCDGMLSENSNFILWIRELLKNLD